MSVMREDGAYMMLPATSAVCAGLKRGGVRSGGRAGGSRARDAGELEGPNSSTYKKKVTIKPRRSQRTRRTRSRRITGTRCLDGGYEGADMAGGAGAWCLLECFDAGDGQWAWQTAADSFWKGSQLRRCARRLGHEQATMKIFAVGGGWGSARRGGGCGGSGLALTTYPVNGQGLLHGWGRQRADGRWSRGEAGHTRARCWRAACRASSVWWSATVSVCTVKAAVVVVLEV